MKRITVIVPAYRSERTLRRTLDSVARQTVSAHRVIVVDDGSENDDCRRIVEEYAERYPDIFIYKYVPHGGPGAARNCGLAEVTTEYVTFLDADDWWRTNLVEEVCRLLDGAKITPDIVYTLPVCWNEGTGKLTPFQDARCHCRVFRDDEVFEPTERPEVYGLEVTACRMIMRTKWVREIGYAFDEGTRWEDVRPYYRAIAHAKYVCGTTRTGFYYRIGRSGQMTDTNDARRLAVVRVFRETMQELVGSNYNAWLGAEFYRRMCEFTMWCLAHTPEKLRPYMIDRLKELFASAPGVMVRDYLRLCPRLKDVLYVGLLLFPAGRQLLGDAELLERLRRWKHFIKS